MEIILDFDRLRVVFVPRQQWMAAENSKRVVSRLIKCMLWPQTRMATDCYYDQRFLVLGNDEDADYEVKSFEYYFNSFGRYCNNPRLFYLLTPPIETRLRREIWEMTPEFGAPRPLSVSQVAYGLWIYYRFAKTMDWDDDFTLRWFEVVKADPSEWERLSGVSAGDVRCFSEVRKYRFHSERW